MLKPAIKYIYFELEPIFFVVSGFIAGNNQLGALRDFKLHQISGQGHISSLFLDRTLSEIKPGHPQKNYPCAYCTKEFTSYGSRWRHITAIHKKMTFACVCGKTYSYKHNLMVHQKSCSFCTAWRSSFFIFHPFPPAIKSGLSLCFQGV